MYLWFMLQYMYQKKKKYDWVVTSKSHLQAVSETACQTVLLKMNSRVWNMGSCCQTGLNGISHKWVHKEAINSEEQEINLASTHRKGIGESGLLSSASWKKLKTLSRLFTFQCSFYAHEDWLHSLRSSQQILTHFSIDFLRRTPANLTYTKKKSKLKAQHMMFRVQPEVWNKEWHNCRPHYSFVLSWSGWIRKGAVITFKMAADWKAMQRTGIKTSN